MTVLGGSCLVVVAWWYRGRRLADNNACLSCSFAPACVDAASVGAFGVE